MYPSNRAFDDIRLINYLYDNDIPTLGICLGMQSMAYAFGGVLSEVNNHHNKKNYSHKREIKYGVQVRKEDQYVKECKKKKKIS